MGDDNLTPGDNGTIGTADKEDRQHQSTTLQHNTIPATTACTETTWQQQTILESYITTTIVRHRTGDNRGELVATKLHEQTTKKVHSKDNNNDARRGMTHRTVYSRVWRGNCGGHSISAPSLWTGRRWDTRYTCHHCQQVTKLNIIDYREK